MTRSNRWPSATFARFLPQRELSLEQNDCSAEFFLGEAARRGSESGLTTGILSASSEALSTIIGGLPERRF